MGTGPSRLGTMSREKLLKGTAVTRNIVDIIFEYLTENITLRDFYSLSSVDRCRRYVLFTANALHKKFMQFQIEPKKGKDGVIYFRSVSDLTEPPQTALGTDPSKDEALQQQALCLQLAYFYVRIFQIYGALALTLVDDSRFMVEQGYISSDRLGLGTGKIAYEAAGPKTTYTLGDKKRFIGGGLYDKDTFNPIPIRDIRDIDLFQVLWPILYVSKLKISDDRRDKMYWIKFDRAGEDKSSGPGAKIFIEPSRRDEGSKYQKAKIILESGPKNAIILYITATYDESSSNIVLKFEKGITIIQGDKDFREDSALDKIQSRYSFVFKGDKLIEGVPLPKWEVYYDRNYYTAESVMKGFLERVWDKYKTVTKPSLIETTTAFKAKDAISNLSEKKWTEEKDVIAALKIQPIVDGMTRKRRFGHCIGRALQLLTTIPSLTGTYDLQSKSTSSICDTKFSKEYIDTPSGYSLKESAGISSLATLFYDTVIEGYPRPDLRIGGESIDEYIKFIKQMSVLFMDKDTSAEDIKRSPEKSLEGIKVQTDPACDKHDSKILINNNFAIKTIYPHVQELFRIQLVHAAECAKIFVQLFEINKVGEQYKIRIHPNVLSKGINEINRIARLTRNLLVTYYSNCETVYLKGVIQIDNSLKKDDKMTEFKDTRKTKDEEDMEKLKAVYKKSDNENIFKSKYTPSDIEEYERERRRDRGYYDRDYDRDDRGYRRDRYRFGGRNITRKRKSK
jgi:hypothetical protein